MTRPALLVLLLAPAAARGGYESDDFRTAAAAFARGVALRHDAARARPAFAEAAAECDALWARGHRRPELALARARAHRLAGNLSRAVAALRAGLAAAPYARELQRELADARAAVAYPLDGELAARCRPRDALTVARRMSPGEAWVLAGGLWLLACLGAARFAMTRAAGWLWFAAGWALPLGALGALWLHHARAAAPGPVLVVAEDAPLRTGNAASFPERLGAPLPQGTEVRELARRGGWVQVELADGTAGWLPPAALVPCDG